MMMRLLSGLLLLISLSPFTAQSEITYVHTDILGSPIMETNEQGEVISRTRYKPFGETLEAPKNDVGYTGHLNDTDLGLTYMQARYYDPLIGRFYSNDPVGFDNVHNFNRYTYANNNPYKYIDPDGKDIALSVDPKAAAGNGHTTLYFQDKKGQWYSYNQGAAGETASGGNYGFLMGQDAKAGVSIKTEKGPAKGSVLIKTTNAEDAKIATSAIQSAADHNSGKKEYNLYSNNCTDAAVDVVNDAGTSVKLKNSATTVKPNTWIKELREDLKKP